MDATIPRLVRWLPRPVFGVTLLCLLFVTLFYAMMMPGMSRGCGVPRMVLVWDEDGAKIVDDWSWWEDGRIEAQEAAHPGSVYILTLWRARRDPSPFPEIFEHPRVRVEVRRHADPDGASAEELECARDYAVAMCASDPEQRALPNPRAPLPVRWSGVWLNALIAGVMLVGVSSLVRGWHQHAAACEYEYRQRSLLRGHCPCCKYSLVGLTHEQCPECGEFIPRDAIAAATESQIADTVEKPIITEHGPGAL
ncbi:MAG: hypothetical protein JNL50_12315 [Phycisphaerae bacterium]|nr:hypothetical protein [Phycisphaerae bacterium]